MGESRTFFCAIWCASRGAAAQERVPKITISGWRRPNQTPTRRLRRAGQPPALAEHTGRTCSGIPVLYALSVLPTAPVPACRHPREVQHPSMAAPGAGSAPCPATAAASMSAELQSLWIIGMATTEASSCRQHSQQRRRPFCLPSRNRYVHQVLVRRNMRGKVTCCGTKVGDDHSFLLNRKTTCDAACQRSMHRC